MIRVATLALLASSSLFAQDKPGWQDRLEKASASPQAWKARREEIRRQILVAAGLWPEYERPPLKSEIFGKVEGEDYSIERVALETLPGFYLSGSLYRPRGKPGPYPAVLAPHGHWKDGRFTQAKDGNFPALGISFARLGFVSFHYDMVGYADLKQLPHKFDDAAWGNGLLGLQTWNSLRAVDFVAALPDVDPKRIGCTGASGGGTQTFLLAAIDERIACAAPVNMVAAEFQGGCSCENAPFLRIGLNNVEIAAMTAPRALLLIAATGDWTRNVPTLEAPVLEKTFEALGVKEKFRAVQFDAPHNYNHDSRQAVYAWMVRWLQNGPDQSRIDERTVDPVKREDLSVWTADHPLPANAINAESLKTLLRERVTAQLASLKPKDAASLKKYRDLMDPAWRLTMTLRPPSLQGHASAGATIPLVVGTKPDEVHAMQDALSAQGKTARSAILGAHDAEPAAGGDATQRKTYPTTFYRTELARQVQSVLDALGQIVGPGQSTAIELIGIGDAGPAVLLARALAPPALRIRRTIVDISSIEEVLEASQHPGLKRLGGWQGAAALAPAGFLVLHGRKVEADLIRASYKAADRESALTISSEPWSRERILEELARYAPPGGEPRPRPPRREGSGGREALPPLTAGTLRRSLTPRFRGLHEQDALGVAAGQHVVEGLRRLVEGIGPRDHLVEHQAPLLVEAEEARQIDLGAALAVERVEVDLVPFEELHVDRHGLLRAAQLDRAAAVAHEGQGRRAERGHRRALEGGIDAAAARHRANLRCRAKEPFVAPLRHHRVGRAEAQGHFESGRIHIHPDDHARPRDPGPLDHRKAHAAGADHRHRLARLDLSDVEDGAHAGLHAAAQDARRGEGDLGVHADHRGSRNHGAGGHGAERERDVDRPALPLEALEGNFGPLLADVLRAAPALEAVAAGDGPIEEHPVAGLQSRHPGAHLLHDPGAFVAQDLDRVAEEELVVGVADPAGLDLDHHFPRLGVADLDRFDGEVALPVGQDRSGFHPRASLRRRHPITGERGVQPPKNPSPPAVMPYS
jgi:dienelactone hydrolase